jgi:hypothetical protein
MMGSAGETDEAVEEAVEEAGSGNKDASGDMVEATFDWYVSSSKWDSGDSDVKSEGVLRMSAYRCVEYTPESAPVG